MTIKKKRCAYVYSVQYKYVYVRIQAIHEEKTSYFAYWPWTPPPHPLCWFCQLRGWGWSGDFATLSWLPPILSGQPVGLGRYGVSITPPWTPSLAALPARGFGVVWRFCHTILAAPSYRAVFASFAVQSGLVLLSHHTGPPLSGVFAAWRSREVWCFYHTTLDPNRLRWLCQLGGSGWSSRNTRPPWPPTLSSGIANLEV